MCPFFSLITSAAKLGDHPHLAWPILVKLRRRLKRLRRQWVNADTYTRGWLHLIAVTLFSTMLTWQYLAFRALQARPGFTPSDAGSYSSSSSSSVRPNPSQHTHRSWPKWEATPAALTSGASGHVHSRSQMGGGGGSISAATSDESIQLGQGASAEELLLQVAEREYTEQPPSPVMKGGSKSAYRVAKGLGQGEASMVKATDRNQWKKGARPPAELWVKEEASTAVQAAGSGTGTGTQVSTAADSAVERQQEGVPVPTGVPQEQARERAEQLFRDGQGYLWFHHMQKAGGSSMCDMFKKSMTLQFPRNNISCLLPKKRTTRRLSPPPGNADHYSRGPPPLPLQPLQPVGSHGSNKHRPQPKGDGPSYLHDIGFFLAQDGAKGITDLEQDLARYHGRSFASEALFAPRHLLENLTVPGAGQEFDMSQFVFVTNFRDPIDRLRSAINYHPNLVEVLHGSLEECTLGEVPVCTHDLFRNFYVRQLAGLYSYHQLPPIASDPSPGSGALPHQHQHQRQGAPWGDERLGRPGAPLTDALRSIAFVGSHTEALFRAADEDDLAFAKEVLQRFTGVVILETMERDLCVMAQKLHVRDLPNELAWSMEGRAAAAAHGSSRAALTGLPIAADVRLRLEELNLLDMELYDFAVELADERARDHPEC